MKTALFDLDGVLVDTMPLIQSAFAHVIDKFGFDKGKIHERAKWRGYTLRQCYEILSGHSDVSMYCKEHGKFQDERPESIQAFVGAAAILQTLKNSDFNIGVITSRSVNARKILLHCDLLPFIDYLVAFEDVSRHKPDPQGIFKALAHFGCRAKDAHMIGDMPVDIETGKNAGVRTIAIDTNDCLEDLRLAKPDHIIFALGQLHPILLHG